MNSENDNKTTEKTTREQRVVEDHIALKNQSSVEAEDYPTKQREDQSLVRKPE